MGLSARVNQVIILVIVQNLSGDERPVSLAHSTFLRCAAAWLWPVGLCLSLLGCATTKSNRSGTNLTTLSVDAGKLVVEPSSNLSNNPENTTLSLNEVSQAQEDGDASSSGVSPEEEEEGPEISAEDLEEGFCKDDIYANYLKQQYLKTAKPVATKYYTERTKKGKKVRVGMARDPEVESTYYARTRLVGPMSPYFGALPVVANPKVEYWMRYFKTSGRRHFLKWLVRGNTVQETIKPLLKDKGVPPELLFLAMIESGFSNSAYSHARATGTWQFMSGTAKLYGLRINHWIDERRDPVKATLAAAELMKDLYTDFGDWYLAMAAYNAGPGKVRKAIAMTGTRDFWKIAETRWLRPETKHYVPKMLAALILASNPKAHEFYDIGTDPADVIPNAAIAVKQPTRVDEIAQGLGISLMQIKTWNPELLRDITPPLRGEAVYHLRLPENLARKFTSIEQSLTPLEVQDIAVHTIRRGDTLAKIARIYKVGIKQIMSMNPDLNKAKGLRIGSNISVPVPGVVVKKKQRSA